MNSSAWAYFFMLMGILGLVIINTSSNLLMTNEQDYFILKEVTEAAMVDSIDYRAFREGLGYDNVTTSSDSDSMHCITGVPGTVRILKEKFVENFTLRFANAVDMAKKYKIIVNDIQECPPKVTVTLLSTHAFDFVDVFTDSDLGEAEIVNKITAILEEAPAEYEDGYSLKVEQLNKGATSTTTTTPTPIPTPTPTLDNTNTLRVEANGGSGSGSWKQAFGTTRIVSVFRTGYALSGWEKSGTCNTIGTGESFTYTFPSSEGTVCTIKANWTKTNSNTLVVDANGGKGRGSWKQNYNTTKEINVSWKGYTFDGWTASGTCGSYTNKASTTYKYPNSDGTTCTLKAKWKKQLYTITLDGQGATKVGTKAVYEHYNIGVYLDKKLQKVMTTKNDNRVTMPEYKPANGLITLNGIVLPVSEATVSFGGYFTKKNCKGTKLIEGYKVVNVMTSFDEKTHKATFKTNNYSGLITKDFTSTYFKKDATLYACWIVKKNPPPKSNGGSSSSNSSGGGGSSPSPSPAPSPSSGGCFLAGTQVKTLFGYENIEDIKPGSMVLTYNEKLQKNEYNKVNALIIHKNMYENIYYLSVEGNEIEVAQEHKFYIKNENGINWIKARLLKVGDNVMFSDGTFHRIDNIRYEMQANTEYDLSIKNTHSYYVLFGNDVLVHNTPVISTSDMEKQ